MMVVKKPLDSTALELRARKRKRWLIWLAPFWVIAALLTVKFFSSAYYTNQGNRDYANGLYPQAMTSYRLAAWPLPFEAYKSSFNMGDTQYQQAQFTQAEASFKKALVQAGNGNWCNIKTNLVLSIVSEGDQQYNSGEFTKAYNTYVLAADDVQQYITCFKSNSATSNQIIDKEGNAQASENGTVTCTSGFVQAACPPSSTGNNQTPTTSEQQTTQQQQQLAQQQLQTEYQTNFEYNPSAPYVKDPY